MLSVNKFIDQRKSLFVLGFMMLGLFIAPNSAKAVTLSTLTSQDATPGFDDADFRLMLDSGYFKELFVAEGRIGNNGFGGNGERELGINKDVKLGGSPVASGDLAWGNGKLWNFSLEYTGSKVTYKVFDNLSQAVELTSQEFSGPITDIFFRTFANKGNNKNLQNTVSLSDLVLDGTGIGSLSSVGSASSADVDYIRVADISASFKLTGKTSLSWLGDAPGRSNLAFQIKVGNSPNKKSVPEPVTLAAIFVAGLAGAFASKRKKTATQQM